MLSDKAASNLSILNTSESRECLIILYSLLVDFMNPSILRRDSINLLTIIDVVIIFLIKFNGNLSQHHLGCSPRISKVKSSKDIREFLLPPISFLSKALDSIIPNLIDTILFFYSYLYLHRFERRED